MSRWRVSFEASATVSVEAETEEQALEAAETTIRTIGIDSLRFSQVSHCSVDVSAHPDT